ncbi:hypothetical protein, partial [Salmonella enterica]|uniref:hypothetical protein n=1 Tax=Salmonella enterica TaxID=28901 RepID=UPI0019D6982B
RARGRLRAPCQCRRHAGDAARDAGIFHIIAFERCAASAASAARNPYAYPSTVRSRSGVDQHDNILAMS